MQVVYGALSHRIEINQKSDSRENLSRPKIPTLSWTSVTETCLVSIAFYSLFPIH